MNTQLKTVEIKDNKKATTFTTENTPQVLVSASVLKRLIANLGYESPENRSARLVKEIRSCNTNLEIDSVLQEEMDFQNTIVMVSLLDNKVDVQEPVTEENISSLIA